MGHLRTQKPVLLVIAAFSRHADVLALAQERLQALYGPIGLMSVPYDFTQTSYYARTMGTDLRKQFLVFANLVDPDCLPPTKHQTNELEAEVAAAGKWPEERPLNLDPGILSLGKFQLATTKDQAHRIYLRDGILCEVTLRFQEGAFEPWPWTYADYRLPEVREFLREARDYYKERLREHTSDDS
jgi:hypothetical protein